MSMIKKEFYNLQEDVYTMTREQFIQKYGNASGEMWDRYHRDDRESSLDSFDSDEY